MALTKEEFETLPIVNKVLWIDPKDSRCGVVLGEDGRTEWLIGKDGDTLSRSSSYHGLTFLRRKDD